MGTSASSNGPASGVPFDPPWLDNITLPGSEEISQSDSDTHNDDSEENQTNPSQQSSPESVEVAPPRRFYGARLALGQFARTGQQDAFRRAVGHYSRTGMGGARNTTRRMRTSTRTATKVFSFLQSARDGTNPEINEWVASLSGRNASPQEIANEIIQRVLPFGGSQDEAACRESMAQAIGDLLTDSPSIDLLHLGNNDIWTLIESFLSYEAFHRLYLDIGQVFEDPRLSPRDRVTRMNEMQNYLKAELQAQIRNVRGEKSNVGSDQLQSILQNALQNTFVVYEGSI